MVRNIKKAHCQKSIQSNSLKLAYSLFNMLSDFFSDFVPMLYFPRLIIKCKGIIYSSPFILWKDSPTVKLYAYLHQYKRSFQSFKREMGTTTLSQFFPDYLLWIMLNDRVGNMGHPV